MSKLDNSRSPQETIQAGLRILARIIARETVKERLAKMDSLNPDPSLTETMAAQIGEYLKGAAQHERY